MRRHIRCRNQYECNPLAESQFVSESLGIRISIAADVEPHKISAVCIVIHVALQPMAKLFVSVYVWNIADIHIRYRNCCGNLKESSCEI